MQNQTPLLPLPDDLPSYPSAVSRLGRIPLLLFQGLEAATAKTAAFRDAESPNERIDEGLAASLVRFHLLKYLRGLGIEASDDECDLDSLPFLGIAFHSAGFHVKVLKGPGGCLPGCGFSEKKVRFYNQVPSLYLANNQTIETKANLIVLWDFDRVYGLSGVWLALPAVGGKRLGDVSAFWIEKLPHPSEGMKGIAPPQPPPPDDLGDLLVPIQDDRKIVGQ